MIRVKLRSALLVAGALFFCQTARAASNPDYNAYASALQSPLLKGKSAALLQISRNYVQQADGTVLLDTTLVEAILAPDAIPEGNLVVPYNADRVRIVSAAAKTVNPDGTLAVAEDTVQDLDAPVSQRFPEYTSLRERVFPMPAVRSGSILVLHLQYRFISGEGLPLVDEGVFQSTLPVLREDVSCALREPGKVFWKAQPPLGAGGNVGFKFTSGVRHNAGMTIYSWILRNVPPAPQDRAQPPAPPLLQYSTLPDWEQVARWYAKIAQGMARPDGAIRSRVQTLTAGLKDPEAVAKTLYNYVSTQYRYVSLSLGAGAYRPHAAAVTFGRQYGDCKDKAVLLLAMLRAAGLDGRLVLVHADEDLPALPSISQLNHVIVQARLPQPVLLDPTTGVYPFGLVNTSLATEHGVLVSAHSPAVIEIPPAPTALMRTVEVNNEVLSRDGSISSDTREVLGGPMGVLTRVELRYTSGDDLEKLKKQLARATLSGTSLLSFKATGADDLASPMLLETSRQMTGEVDWTKNPVEVPLWWHGGPGDLGSSTPSRVSPLVLSQIVLPYEQTIRITLPLGEVPVLPKDVRLNPDFAQFSVHYAWDAKHHQLVARSSLAPLLDRLPASREGEYRQFQSAADKALVDQIELHLDAAASPEALSASWRGLRTAEREENWAQAVTLAKALLLAAPGNALVRDSLAHALLEQGKVSEAAPVLKAQLKRFPNDPYVHRELALLDLKRGQYSDAQRELDLQVQRTPYDVDTLRLRGDAAFKSGQWAQALAAYQRASGIAPDNISLKVAEGVAELHTGQVVQADALFTEIDQSGMATARDYGEMGAALLGGPAPMNRARAYLLRALGEWQQSLSGASTPDVTGAGREALRQLPGLLLAIARADFFPASQTTPQRLAQGYGLLDLACAMRPNDLRILRQAVALEIQEGRYEQALAMLALEVHLPDAPDAVFSQLLNVYSKAAPDSTVPVNVYLLQHPGLLKWGTLPLKPTSVDGFKVLVSGGTVYGSGPGWEFSRKQVTQRSWPDPEVGGHALIYELYVCTDGKGTPYVCPPPKHSNTQ